MTLAAALAVVVAEVVVVVVVAVHLNPVLCDPSILLGLYHAVHSVVLGLCEPKKLDHIPRGQFDAHVEHTAASLASTTA